MLKCERIDKIHVYRGEKEKHSREKGRMFGGSFRSNTYKSFPLLKYNYLL